MKHWITIVALSIGLGAVYSGPGATHALAGDEPAGQPEASSEALSLADGKLRLTPPAKWIKKKPMTNIIEQEFAVPAVEGDENDGRATMSAAGGSVDDNIQRWIGQFSDPEGGDAKKRAKVTQDKIGGQEVHLIDVSGTYKDQRGPFAPAVTRKDYRMLAAVIPLNKRSNYFVKFYGPVRTVNENEKAFRTMIESLKVK